MNRQSLKTTSWILALGIVGVLNLLNSETGTAGSSQPESMTSTEMLLQLTEPPPNMCVVNGVEQPCPNNQYSVYTTPTPPEYQPTPKDSQIPTSVLSPDNPLYKYYDKWQKASPETREANVVYSKLYSAFSESGKAEGIMAGGSYSWGDVHLTQFDGAKCDTNNSFGWHNYYSKGQSGVGDEQLNVDMEPWGGNSYTSVLKGYALKARYGGTEHEFLFTVTQPPTLDGQPIAKVTDGKLTSIGKGIWVRWDGLKLTLITPATEYGLIFMNLGQSSVYGNMSMMPRRAPHVGGFPDGVVGQSIRFDGKVYNTHPKATAGSNCDNETIQGKVSDYKTSGPFALDDSHSRYGKNILSRPLDGFYPITSL